MWVNDDGSLREIDRLPRPMDGSLSGSNIANVLFGPQRRWVIFHGSYSECWNLNPDGTFGERRWRNISTEDNGQADLSADGRVLIVGHLTLFNQWRLTIIRLTPDGDIERTISYPVPLAMVPPSFITRRRPGDTNGDGWIDISDLVTLINHVREGSEIGNPVDFDHADVDRDGDRDEDDIPLLADLILHQ